MAFLFTACFNGPDTQNASAEAQAQADETVDAVPAEDQLEEGINSTAVAEPENGEGNRESADTETEAQEKPADTGALLQGLLLCVIAAPAMAIFGILPQAVVADIAESDELDTKENRSGMFYAARTFSMKMGQSIGVLLVSSLATIGLASGTGYRIVAVVAAVVCMTGGLLFMKYDEKKIYAKIIKNPDQKA